LTLIFGVCFNLGTILIYYIWLNERTHGTATIFWQNAHIVCYYLSLVLLTISLPLFLLTVLLQPGHLRPTYEYAKLVEVALDIGLHLDNFCSYCEVIKSETSFHCTICNRCVELFDHHCPFINNCLGYRNHKYFLSFIFLYSIFLSILLFETLRHFVEIYRVIGWSCLYTDSLCTTNIILIFLHFPVFAFQWQQQCKNLCKRPNLPPQFINLAEYEPLKTSIDSSSSDHVGKPEESVLVPSMKATHTNTIKSLSQSVFTSKDMSEGTGSILNPGGGTEASALSFVGVSKQG